MLQAIIDKAVDSNTDIGELLRSCKVLASRLNSEALENWLVGEMNGYSEYAELPEYRIWPQIIKGSFVGPLGASMQGVQIAPALLPEDWRERITVARAYDSVTAIEATLSQSDEGMIRTDQGNLALVLGATVYDQANCISAWGEFHRSRLVGVLEAVRSRVLDFALALQKENPDFDSSSGESPPVSQERVTQYVNMIMTGGSANIIGLANNSEVSASITAGEFESLAAYLKEHKVGVEEIAQLREALDSDPEPAQKGSFGPRVSDWIGSMMKLAASGTWQIAWSTAGALLVDAIQSFYG